jgi:hypothetical protein
MMERSRAGALLFFSALFFLLPQTARSQEERAAEAPKVLRRFSWEADEYASRYEVRIETLDSGGSWIESRTEVTQGDFIEFFFLPGSYRFRIQAYDLLENPTGSPEWIYFEVPLPAPEQREAPGPGDSVPVPGADFADIFISLGYAPLIPLYGALNELLEDSVFPTGLYGRLSFVPVKTDAVNIGFGGEVSWTEFSTEYAGEKFRYDVSGRLFGFACFVIFQKPLGRHVNFDFRLGGGLFSIMGFEKHGAENSSGEINALFPAVGGGAALQWLFTQFFFVELGAEYLHLFSVDDPSPGYCRPVFGAGLRW